MQMTGCCIVYLNPGTNLNAQHRSQKMACKMQKKKKKYAATTSSADVSPV